MTTATDAINGPRARSAMDMAGSTATNAVEVAGAALQNARARAGPLLEQVQTQLPDLWAAPAADATAAGVAAAATAGATAGATVAAAAGGAAASTAVTKDDPFLAGASPAEAAEPQTQEATSPAEVPAAVTKPTTKPVAAPPAQNEGPAAAAPESEMPAAKPTNRKSLVSMRSKMFQKPKPDDPKM